MFERFTEKARRVIFFARYEVSQFGSPAIESEHLLLALFRESNNVVRRLGLSAESIRKQIDSATVIREQVSTSVDLPLSSESKHVLFYASEEADALGHKHIGTEHLLVGLMREEGSFAAELLREAGVTLNEARKQLSTSTDEPPPKLGELATGAGHVPLVQFIQNNEPLLVNAFRPSTLPRVGDEIVLRSVDGSTSSHRVENVRFIVERAAQRLEKVQVIVKGIPSP